MVFSEREANALPKSLVGKPVAVEFAVGISGYGSNMWYTAKPQLEKLLSQQLGARLETNQ